MALGFHYVLRGLRRFLTSRPAEEVSDRQLLERFRRDHDQTAFAEVMARHGPMVMGVCQRTARGGCDPADLFQATFLVLFRKAASLAWHSSIASWLHQTALRVSWKANSAAARRRAHEREAAAMRALQASTEAGWDDLAEVLDGELDHLADKYRLPLVLCGLEGKSHEEAARLLGWPLGTLKGRLFRARDLLRERLKRRGLQVGAGGFLTLLAEQSCAAVPVSLTDATLHGLWTTTSAGTALSPAVHNLAQEAMRDMFLSKAKKIAVAVLLVVGLGAGAGWAWFHSGGDDPAGGRAELKLPAELPVKPEAPGETPLPPGAVARLGTPRPSVLLQAQKLALTPKGDVLASAGPAGSVALTDVASGKEIRRITWKVIDTLGGGHQVLALAFSGDGKRLAVAGTESSARRPAVEEFVLPNLDDPSGRADIRRSRVRVFSVDTGKQLFDLEGPRGIVSHLAFSAAGDLLAAGGDDTQLVVWNATTGKELHRPDVTPPGGLEVPFNFVRALAFSPDGKTLLCRSSGALRLWETESGKLIKTIPRALDEELIAATFSADGKLAAGSGGPDATVWVWEAATGKQVCEIVTDPVAINHLAFSADGRTLAGAGDDRRVRFWDTRTGKEKSKALTLGKEAASLVWSGDDKTLAVIAGMVRLFDPASGVDRWAGPGHADAVRGVVWGAKGDWLASIAEDGVVCIWQPGKSLPLRKLTTPDAGLTTLALSPDARSLACGSTAGVIHCFDTGSWKETSKLTDGKALITSLSFSPDGKRLLAASVDGVARLWDVPGGKVLHKLEAAGEGRERVAPFPGQLGEIVPLQPLPSLMGGLTAAALSPDGDTIITTHIHMMMHFWSAATGKEKRQVTLRSPVNALAFSPDGAFLAAGEGYLFPEFLGQGKAVPVAGGGAGVDAGGIGGGIMLPIAGGLRPLRLWDMSREKEFLSLPWNEDDPGPLSVHAVAFSPDGRLVACSGGRGGIFLYELASGRFYRSFKANDWPVNGLAFSPDGRKLASGHEDAGVLIWQVEAEPIKDASLEKLWQDLGLPEAAKAWPAAEALARQPEATAFLRKQVEPLLPITRNMAILLDDLASKEFATREKAHADLGKAIVFAAPRLRSLLKKGVELELRQRVTKLLGRMTLPLEDEETLRLTRALLVLERTGTKESRALLSELGQ